MIKTTTIDGKEFLISAKHIESIQQVQNYVIVTMTSGVTYSVQTTAKKMLEEMKKFI
jgi:uncharacterized protein YlzI (FlbEa/FlbD family)